MLFIGFFTLFLISVDLKTLLCYNKSMLNYKNLSKETEDKILKTNALRDAISFGFKDENSLRRKDNPHDYSTAIRSAFIRDVDKILNCPYYNRYADKTQVFSLTKNDDLSRRGLHVQLVSRISRTIGKALNLNLELIEAIALGHDLGHTPFGHAGESVLDHIYSQRTGRRFAHNIHSVRVVDKIFPLNLTLQTLDGIACHNGEVELEKYSLNNLSTFLEFDNLIESCYLDNSVTKKLIPSTLEGCVVRISDIIAYLGKDRQDSQRNDNEKVFADYGIGVTNAEIINNLTVDLIENSLGKPFIKLSEKVFDALKKAKADNYACIYNDNGKTKELLTSIIGKTYDRLLSDLEKNNTCSPIYKHHIEYLNKPYYKREFDYAQTEKNQIVVDYIASMTDDYIVELFHHLFPNDDLDIKYKGYFE